MNRRIVLALVLVAVCLLLVYIFTSQSVNAQSVSGATINPDGSITGTNSIQRDGDTYRLTGNISGGLQIQKTGVIIDGAGYALIGDGTGRGIDLSINSGELPVFRSIETLTVKNLIITDFLYCVYIANSGSNIFYANTVTNCGTGFWITGDSNNDILYNTIQDNIDGVFINSATGNNMISHNNLINSGITVWHSTQPSVDKNYWNDYLPKYPTAIEIGNSGIGDIPYAYDSINNFTDNHPLIRPISTSNIEFPPEIPSKTGVPTPTATVAVVGSILNCPATLSVSGPSAQPLEVGSLKS